MTDDSNDRLTRRTALKLTGGLAVAGGGAIALTGSGAASSISVGASSFELSSDHGEIDRVSVQPDITIDWDGFDEVVGKVRIFIEASPHDAPVETEYAPVFRATGWMGDSETAGVDNETGPGYNGTFEVSGPWFPDGVTLYDRDGPDYGTFENKGAYFDGTSVGQELDESSFENGLYEQAGTVDRFFNETDDSKETTEVSLRYTVSLHAPSDSSVGNYDVPADDVAENSPLVMAHADDVDNPIPDDVDADAIPYDVLRDHADGHPAIMVTEPMFNVTVENEDSSQDTTGDSNTNGSASDDVTTEAPTAE